MLPVIFHELAENELTEAAAYYAQARPSLGEVFLADVRHAAGACAGALASSRLSFAPLSSSQRTSQMPADSIVEEIHVVREVLSKASGDDIRKIAEAARARQMQSGRKAERLSPRKVRPLRKAS